MSSMSSMNFMNDNLDPSSSDRYTDVVELFNKHIKQSGKRFALPMIKDYLSTIQNPNTYNLARQALKSYYDRQYQSKPLADQARLNNLFRTIRRKRINKVVGRSKYFTIEEINTLVSNATARNACFIEALFYSGSRISALLNATLNDCTVVGAFVRIKITAKCSIQHEVIITLKLRDRIRQVFGGKIYLFETIAGKKYKREYVSREIKDTGKDCKLQANCHKLRHSLAMYLKQQGHSADEIAGVLGHQGVLTTLEHYFHGSITPEEQLGAFI